LNHRIGNIVRDTPTKFDSSGREIIENWWQSQSGQEKVFIQFDLEAMFTMTHLILRFKGFQPAAMIIEKSQDFGLSWHPAAYYASDCHLEFPFVSTIDTGSINEPFCTNKYSGLSFLNGGELLYKPLASYSKRRKYIDTVKVRASLRVTNVRINFTKLYIPNENYLNKYERDEIIEKYYYAISEFQLFGSCFCNGHASECVAIKSAPIEYDTLNDPKQMVHGQCDCKHNTAGLNCEKCLPLYNDRPYNMASNDLANECRKCECNNHATSCTFCSDRFIETNGMSGGICDNCQHNTQGPNCNECKSNYYRDLKYPINHEMACKSLILFISFKNSVFFVMFNNNFRF
jgi:laminin, beta 1